MVTKGARTKEIANKVKKAFQEQGYRLVKIAKNPKSIVGTHNIKKYTVVAMHKIRKKRK